MKIAIQIPLRHGKDMNIFLANENDSEKMAVVRFDVNSTRASVSINLSPKMRG